MLWLSNVEFEHIDEAGLTTQKSWFQEKANWGKYLLAFGIVYILDHYQQRANNIIQRAFTKRAKRAVIPPKCSNHLTESKRGLVGNTRLLPRAKMLLVPKINFSGGYIIFWVPLFQWVNVNFAACFILRGLDTHIDFLRLLFLVGMICPLMQEHFLRPLLKRKSLPLRLNKSFRLFILL